MLMVINFLNNKNNKTMEVKQFKPVQKMVNTTQERINLQNEINASKVNIDRSIFKKTFTDKFNLKEAVKKYKTAISNKVQYLNDRSELIHVIQNNTPSWSDSSKVKVLYL